MSRTVGSKNSQVRREREVFVSMLARLIDWDPTLTNAELTQITGRFPTEVSRAASGIRERKGIPPPPRDRRSRTLAVLGRVRLLLDSLE